MSNRDQFIQKLAYLRKSLSGEPPLYPSVRDGIAPVELALSDESLSASITKEEFHRFSRGSEFVKEVRVTAYLGKIVKKQFDGNRNLPHQIYCATAELVLSNDGSISVSSTQPIIQKGLLANKMTSEGSFTNVVLGTFEDFDRFIVSSPWKAESIAGLLEYVSAMQDAVCSEFLEKNSVYERSSSVQLCPAVTSITQNLEFVYDELERNLLKGKDAPLLSTMLRGDGLEHVAQVKPACDAMAVRAGHMSPSFPLADAQRLALTNLGTLRDGEVLTLNGPPGTGKTTLLQSVVASNWVQSAIRGDRYPPITVACSTNNQAVTNILTSFSSIEENPASSFYGRWIDGLDSYGTYFRDSQTDFFDLSKVNALESSDKDKTIQNFLARFKKCFKREDDTTLSQATAIMSTSLKKGWSILKGIEDSIEILSSARHKVEQLRTEGCLGFMEPDSARAKAFELQSRQETYEVAHKEWLDYKTIILDPRLVSRGFPAGKLKEFINALIEDYRLSEISHLSEITVSPEEFESILSNCIEICQKNALLLSNFAGTLDHNSQLLNEAKQELILTARKLGIENPDSIQIEALDRAADFKIRQPLFKLATHYWEARWLQEMNATLWAGNPDKTYFGKPFSESELQKIYGRRAMLTPCFVSTFHSLPKYFSFKNRLENSIAFNFADLLIVDEAGQVTPEVGITGFAFAKKALVVGDTFQIEPVWSVTKGMDFCNAESAGLISEDLNFIDLENSGFSSSSGSIMKIAQNASRLHSDLSLAPGLHLYEHRRGYDDLIAFCNELCYQNKLIPMRGSKKDDERSLVRLPAMGYAHIPGKSDRPDAGSRLNTLEAKMIAHWILSNAPKLVYDYKKKLSEIAAIITPFRPQSSLIKKLLSEGPENLKIALGETYKSMGLNVDVNQDISDITVGTVHSLQGAEKPIVLFSPVYSKHDRESDFFFDESPSMLNVSVSRAKDAFLVFGDTTIFSLREGKPSSLLGKYLFSKPSNEIKIPIENLLRDDLIKPINTKTPPEFISNLEGHRQALSNSFKMARNNLMIVSPWITRHVMESDGILEMIADASNRNVDVQIFLAKDSNLQNYSEDEFAVVLQELESAGAKVGLVNKMHQKVIYIDDDVMISGSFNWLSSSRTEKYQLMEKSVIYHSDIVRDEKLNDLAVLDSLKTDLRKPEPSRGLKMQVG